jgi:hypothetical protein
VFTTCSWNLYTLIDVKLNVCSGIRFREDELRLLFETSSPSGDSLINTNPTKIMYKATELKELINAKNFTPAVLDKEAVICEEIEARTDQSRETIDKLQKEIYELEAIYSNINRAVESRNLKMLTVANEAYEKFINDEKDAFDAVKE